MRSERHLCSHGGQLWQGGEDSQARRGAVEEAAGSSRTLDSGCWGCALGTDDPGLVRSSGGRLSWRETGSAEKGGKLQDRDVGQWFSTKGPVSVLQGGVSSLSRVPGPLAQLDAVRVHTSPPLLLYC